MSDNQLKIELKAGLDIQGSIAKINSDIQKLEGQLKHLKLQARFDNGKTNTEIQKQITALNKQKRQLYIDLKLRQKDLKKQYKLAVSQINQKPIEVDVSTQNAQGQLSELSSGIKTTKSETVTLANTLTKALNNMGLVVSAQTALQLVRKAVQEATEAVKEYDKYATNLSMITGDSRESANKTIADLTEKSFDFKANISELEGAYETLLRTGKTAEEIDDYLKSTVYLSKIGFENMDVSAENLVTIANAYKLQSNEIEDVVSKLSALDTASMTVAGKLSTAMSETAQNAQLAGLNIDKLGAIISGLRDTTGKSEDELATSLNGILTRLYNVKLGKYEIELEDGSTENISESLNNVERMLKTVGMDIRTSKGEFKDVSDIIDELVSKWDKLNDVQKNSIGFTFAGTHHKNTFIALVENWNRINELTEVSADSAGQAQRKYNAYLNSIEAKSAALSNAVKDLWNNLIPNGFVGDITDAATKLVQFTDEYQILQTAVKSAAFYALAKGIVSAKNGFSGMITDIKNVSYAMNIASNSSAITKEQFSSLSVVLSRLSDKQLKLVLCNSDLTESEMIKALTIDGTTEAEARQRLATLGITQANQQAAVSTFSLNGSMKALFATISANPVMVLTMAFTALVSIYQRVQREQKKARQNAVEAAEKYDEQAKSLQELKQQYIDIVDNESDVAKKTEELNEWKKTLIETYGFEKAALENVNLEREKGLGLIEDEINKNRISSAETWLTDNNIAYEDAKKKLTSRNNSSENSVIPQANVVTQVTQDTLNDFSDNFTDILKKFSISSPTKDNPLAQIKIKGNNTLQQYENLNEILNEITSVKVSRGLNDTEEKLYNSLLEKQKAYKKVVTDDIKDIYETGNKYANSIKLFNFETDSGINFENVTQETYKEFRDKFLESLNLGDKKDSMDFSLDVEQILLDMMPDFEKVYRGIEDTADKAVQNIEETTEISSEEASKSLEDLQKSYENLSKFAANYIKSQKSFTSALEEQEKHGQLSASTIQELTDAGYSQALVVDSETGAVTLNKQAYEQLNNEKKQAIKLEAEQQKSYLEQKYNDEQKAISDLTLEMKYANAERRTAIMLELSQHSQNMAEYLDMIDKINGNVARLDSPEFGSDKETKPKSVTDFEAEYARRQHEINMGRMKEDEDYYSWLLEAAHTAYDGLKDYESDLWKYEEEVYKGRKQLTDDFYDEQQQDLEDRISALENDIEIAVDDNTDSEGNILGLEEKIDYITSAYQEIINEINSRINDILDMGIEGHEDDVAELEKQIEEYQKKLSGVFDDVFKTAAEDEKEYIENLKDKYSDLYDERINKIKEQKEEAENAAQAEIDAVQEKIDALKKANDKEQEALDIAKARKELETASQSTRQVYGADGSISFQVDKEKVQEAQENLDKLLLEQQTNLLEEQKELLEQAKDKESEAYDNIIENLETGKDNEEKRFDILLEALDKYLNPEQDTSNSEVWKALAHIEGATYKNGVWSDKDGNVIDLETLIKAVENNTEDNKNAEANTSSSNDSTNTNTNSDTDIVISGNLERLTIGSETGDDASNIKSSEKTETGFDKFLSILENNLGLKNGTLTLDKITKAFNTSREMGYSLYMALNERMGNAGKGYVNNVNNNNNASKVTIGDIVIQNPVGNSDDLVKELALNLPNAFQKQMYTNLK